MCREKQTSAVSKLAKSVLWKTEIYKRTQTACEKKQKGQYFTSERIADFMAKLVSDEKPYMRILDPGAGNGLLALKVLEYLLKSDKTTKIHITYVENDSDILPVLYLIKKELESISVIGPVDISCDIEYKNFLLDPVEENFDLVISNPPYFKISKNSDEARAMSSFLYGQPNVYALFIVKALQKLDENGNFIFITPRSWTSGSYFLKMREYLFSNASITNIHLFDVRDKVFSSENVLQETIIWSGVKKKNENQQILISTSENDYFNNFKTFSVSRKDVVTTDDYRMFLPLDNFDYELLKSINTYSYTFDSLGYSFKTGPVVEFRNQMSISNRPSTHSIPMFRSLNIRNGSFVFPVITEKAQYVDVYHNESLRIKNMPTIIVKRLSAKEEERRLQCCRYFPFSDDEFISMENHVNYLVRKDGASLSDSEVEWAYQIISSERYDKYFRMISGSTQVNAKDLNTLPVPVQ